MPILDTDREKVYNFVNKISKPHLFRFADSLEKYTKIRDLMNDSKVGNWCFTNLKIKDQNRYRPLYDLRPRLNAAISHIASAWGYKVILKIIESSRVSK